MQQREEEKKKVSAFSLQQPKDQPRERRERKGRSPFLFGNYVLSECKLFVDYIVNFM